MINLRRVRVDPKPTESIETGKPTPATTAPKFRDRPSSLEGVIVRYADDLVIGFESHDEAQACLEALRTRLAKFGLKLHEGKTRLIEFGRYAIENRQRRGDGR